MKDFARLSCALLLLGCISCDRETPATPEPPMEENGPVQLRDVARMLSALSIGDEQLAEVHDAVSGSAGNGYDEEYTMKDLFESPGAAVGGGTKASYGSPLRDLIRDYLQTHLPSTRSGASDVEDYINALAASDIQIYWPFSDSWDGETMPLVTYDPGYGAESNYAYEIAFSESGAAVVDSVLVDEAVAQTRPVWVINRNDDSAFTPMEFYLQDRASAVPESAADAVEEAFTAASTTASTDASTKASKPRKLYMKHFKMLRQYDSWFGGASEFFIKVGCVEGFTAKTEAELALYKPSVTDFMVVVKRGDLGKNLPYEVLMVSDFTSQMEKLAFLIIEDDGGTVTSWKCSATVKIASKSYGFDLDIPYKDKDDIVWRGQLAASFFEEEDEVVARFGDVTVGFGLE